MNEAYVEKLLERIDARIAELEAEEKRQAMEDEKIDAIIDNVLSDFVVPSDEKKCDEDMKAVVECPVPDPIRQSIINTDAKKEEETRAKFEQFLKEWTPKRIIEFLDTRVLGQEEAKKQVALFLYRFVQRCTFPEKFKRRNVLLIWGPSGSGKSELFRALNEIAPMRIVFISGADVTTTGFSGADWSAILRSALGRSYNVREPVKERLIIVVDEFDKMASKKHDKEGGVVSNDIQSALLQTLETGQFTDANGHIVNIPFCDFALVGAFEGMINNSTSRAIGFTSDSDAVTIADETEALISWGVMPEICSRIGSIAQTKELTEEDYVMIMQTPSMSPVQFLADEYSADNIKLKVPRETILSIAQVAHKANLGARKIISIMRQAGDDKLIEAIEAKKREIVITREDVEKVTSR